MLNITMKNKMEELSKETQELRDKALTLQKKFAAQCREHAYDWGFVKPLRDKTLEIIKGLPFNDLLEVLETYINVGDYLSEPILDFGEDKEKEKSYYAKRDQRLKDYAERSIENYQWLLDTIEDLQLS